MDGGEETGTQVVVEVLVLGHLKHLLPLLNSHLLLYVLCRLLLLWQLFTPKLTNRFYLIKPLFCGSLLARAPEDKKHVCHCMLYSLSWQVKRQTSVHLNGF